MAAINCWLIVSLVMTKVPDSTEVFSWKLGMDRLALRSPANLGADVMAVCNTRLAPPGPGDVASITIGLF